MLYDDPGGDVLVTVDEHQVVLDFLAHGYWVAFEPWAARMLGELLIAASFGGRDRAPASGSDEGRRSDVTPAHRPRAVHINRSTRH